MVNIYIDITRLPVSTVIYLNVVLQWEAYIGTGEGVGNDEQFSHTTSFRSQLRSQQCVKSRHGTPTGRIRERHHALGNMTPIENKPIRLCNAHTQ